MEATQLSGDVLHVSGNDSSRWCTRALSSDGIKLCAHLLLHKLSNPGRSKTRLDYDSTLFTPL
jgi:hypothetical protein